MKNDVAMRFETVLGGRGTRAKLARMLGYRREHVGKVLNGHEPIPQAWIVVLEFLERVPPDEWPEPVKAALQPGGQ